MKDMRRVILLVDDDGNDRCLLERSFKHLDKSLTIQTVNSGNEALAYLDGKGEVGNRKRFPFPTLLFTDLKMPGLDGFGVLQYVKKNPKWGIIPTVVFTGSSDLDDIKKAFLCGAGAYHVKPCSAEDRVKLCRLLLDYWAANEIPQTDDQGEQVTTASAGRLGERIAQP